jgi:hypothetical protein
MSGLGTANPSYEIRNAFTFGCGYAGLCQYA